MQSVPHIHIVYGGLRYLEIYPVSYTHLVGYQLPERLGVVLLDREQSDCLARYRIAHVTAVYLSD